MARDRYTGNRENLRRSARLLGSYSRKSKKGNENETIEIESEDENRGDMDREVHTPQTQIIPTQLQDPDTVWSQIVPYGYCFEDEVQQDGKVDSKIEGRNEQIPTMEATNDSRKDTMEANMKDINDSRKDREEEEDQNMREYNSEEDHVILSEIMRKKNKGKRKIVDQPTKNVKQKKDNVVLSEIMMKNDKGKRKIVDNSTKKIKIGEQSTTPRRVTRQSSGKKKPVTRINKQQTVRKKKLLARTDRKKKTEREGKYSRGSVLGINREDLYEAAPLILPRDKWSSSQKLNIYSRYEVIKNIKDKLSKKHIRRFQNSCFGKFLDIKIAKFPSQLLYHLIRRQCSLTKGDELCFNLEGRVVRFYLKDFQKIIGLNCGELPEMDMQKMKGRLLNKYFEGEKPIKRTIVSDLFLSMEGVKKKDKVRLAKLYFLSNFLLGKQVCTGVELEHITLLDDDEQFDKYPWGRIAYNTTIDSIKKAIKNPDAMIVGISGFPQALVVWAYECIPLLSGPSIYIAQKVSSGSPKMNNWIADVHPEWKDLAIKVFEHENFQFFAWLTKMMNFLM